MADQAVQAVRRYLAAGVPVEEHLADQLLLPLALAGRGSFRTLAPSSHAKTNLETIARFLDLEITWERCGDETWLVRVAP